MKSKKLNRTKRTKRTKKTKKNMKGGAVCTTSGNKIKIIFTTTTPKIEKEFEYGVTITDEFQAFTEFINKINTHLSSEDNGLVNGPYEVVSFTAMNGVKIDQSNIKNYCIDKHGSVPLFCYTMKKINDATKVQDLLNMIITDKLQMNLLKLLSKYKPIVTETSSSRVMMLGGIQGIGMLFPLYWKKFSPEEKELFINLLKSELPQENLNLGIYVSEGINSSIFYSIPDFERLCSVFGYTKQEGFNILTGSMTDNTKWLFMWLSFGNLTTNLLSDDYGIPDATTQYSSFRRDKINIKGEERTYQSLVLEYMQDENKKYNSSQIRK